MTPKERAVMQQALEALEKIAYDTANPDTEKAITAMREALAEQVHTPYCKQAPMCKTPCGNSDCVEQAECPHGVDDGACKECYMEQAEQEPVAWMYSGGFSTSDPSGWATNSKVFPLYAHPVRTADLTDDEIMKINVDTASIVPTCDRQFHFARAVIAADREKNK